MRLGSPRSRTRLWCSALALAFALAAAEALAAAPRIAVERSGLAEPVVARLHAELEALGFEVLDMPRAAEADPPEALERAARNAGAVAAVRAAKGGPDIEVWVINQTTGTASWQRVGPADLAATTQDATAALRTVELLRASLLEVRRRRRPAHVPRAPPEPRALPTSQTGAPRLPRVSVELGPAASISPGGLSPAPSLLVAARFMPAGFVGVGTFALVPLFAARLSGAEGSASLRPLLFGGGLRLAGRFGVVMPSAELGIGGAWIHASGSPAPGYAARSVDHVVGAAYARAGLSVPLSARVAVRADLLAGAALPEVQLVIAGRQVASWGRPFVAPSVGVELTW